MLPNWLYGKSKSKLAELLGGGGAPADYNQVKAQVTQNTESIALLNNTVAAKVGWDDYNEVGAVNFAPCTATSQTITRGTDVTFVVNDDGSITENSSAAITGNIDLVTGELTLKKGCTYRVSDTKDGKKYNSVSNSVFVRQKSNAAWLFSTKNSTVLSDVYTPSEDVIVQIGIQITPDEGAILNKTIYPMVCPVSYKGPYVPYAKTNKELTDDVESIEAEMVRGGGYVYKITSYFKHIVITLPGSDYGLVKLCTQHGEVFFSSSTSEIVANTLNTQKVLLNRTDSAPVWTYTINGRSVAFDLVTSATAIIFSTIPLEITTSNESTPETNTMGILNLASLSNS